MPTAAAPPPGRPGDVVQDPTALRALAHPTRMALLEFLGTRGQATATDCAEELGQSVASCSFHLRSLAKHGFIERVPASNGKDRPWRVVSTRQNIGASRTTESGGSASRVNPEAGDAEAEFVRVFLGTEFARLSEGRRRSSSEAPEWRQTMIGSSVWITATELADLKAELERLALRYADRGVDASSRPHGARLVRLLFAASVSPRSDRKRREAESG